MIDFDRRSLGLIRAALIVLLSRLLRDPDMARFLGRMHGKTVLLMACRVATSLTPP
jgi:hypothetical protein